MTHDKARARWLVAFAVAIVLVLAAVMLRHRSLHEVTPRGNARSPNGRCRVAVLVHTFPEGLLPTMPGDGVGNRPALVRILDSDERVLHEGPVSMFGRDANANEIQWSWNGDEIQFSRAPSWTSPPQCRAPSKNAPTARPAAPVTPSAPPAATVPTPAPTVTATLTLQKVYSDCGHGDVLYLGTDVFVTLQAENEKASKEFVFCPSALSDGGKTRPKLQMWQNCSSFARCEVVESDASTEGAAGPEHHVEVRCGNERIELRSDDQHTVVRGSFGVRELLPQPSRVGRVKMDVRHAIVDC